MNIISVERQKLMQKSADGHVVSVVGVLVVIQYSAHSLQCSSYQKCVHKK